MPAVADTERPPDPNPALEPSEAIGVVLGWCKVQALEAVRAGRWKDVIAWGTCAAQLVLLRDSK